MYQKKGNIPEGGKLLHLGWGLSWGLAIVKNPFSRFSGVACSLGAAFYFDGKAA